MAFRHAGVSPIESEGADNASIVKNQLQNFYFSLQMHGMKKSHRPKDWLEAFFMLEQLLQEKDTGERQVIFLDELPWLDTPGSRFITAFEGFWTNWACHRKNIMLIVCASATAWILGKQISKNEKLYKLFTYEIKLSPFTLSECKEFLDSKNISLSLYDIAQSYMILGGVPFYFGYLEKGLSLAQGIDKIFFQKNAKLRDEYDRLFDSGFSSPGAIKAIVQALYTRNAGLTRREIVEKLKITDSGHLSKHLKALIASDFVLEYVPFGLGKRETHYKLVDPFCMFCLKFVNGKNAMDETFWQQSLSSQSVISWRGFAFENVCFNHIAQIKNKLGISGVATKQSVWSKRADDTEGAQIDMIIERGDNVVNMCGIKFWGDDFTVSKEYNRTLVRRQELLSHFIHKKSIIRNTLITTFGLTYNEYSGSFTDTITLEDLMN